MKPLDDEAHDAETSQSTNPPTDGVAGGSVRPDGDEVTTQSSDAAALSQAPQGQPADEAASLRVERDRMKEQLLRTAADFDNFRKRTRRDIEDAMRRGREDAVRELLTVVDNLERAVAAASKSSEMNALLEGLQMVLRQWEDVGARLGIERVRAVGERFDPSVHEAVQQVESEEHPVGTIVAEITPAYRIGERLLRAGMVVVSKGAPSAKAPSVQPSGSGMN